MTIQLTIYKWLYTIDYVHSQVTIFIVKWLHNWLYTNDYTIDYIHSQMSVQLTMYKWQYNWLYT